MKKIFSIALVAVLALSLVVFVACKGKTSADAEVKTNEAPKTDVKADTNKKADAKAEVKKEEVKK